jgi:hypothetical protein
MPVPKNAGGWSRIATGLTQEEAERFAACCVWRARAMPDREDAKITAVAAD